MCEILLQFNLILMHMSIDMVAFENTAQYFKWALLENCKYSTGLYAGSTGVIRFLKY